MKTIDFTQEQITKIFQIEQQIAAILICFACNLSLFDLSI